MTVERVSATEAHRRMRDAGYVYLDVRSVQEFDNGHPAGAFNIPLLHMGSDGMTPNQSFLTDVEGTFAKETPILVGCRYGQRSLRAAEALIAAGYTDVADVRAGFAGAANAFGQVAEAGWASSGLPVSRSAKPGRSYADLSK
jgi:rhodanese-related sulfurtransferase